MNLVWIRMVKQIKPIIVCFQTKNRFWQTMPHLLKLRIQIVTKILWRRLLNRPSSSHSKPYKRLRMSLPRWPLILNHYQRTLYILPLRNVKWKTLVNKFRILAVMKIQNKMSRLNLSRLWQMFCKWPSLTRCYLTASNLTNKIWSKKQLKLTTENLLIWESRKLPMKRNRRKLCKSFYRSVREMNKSNMSSKWK